MYVVSFDHSIAVLYMMAFMELLNECDLDPAIPCSAYFKLCNQD